MGKKRKKRVNSRGDNSTRWVNLVSPKNEKRAWELREALKPRQSAKKIVIDGDYETKVYVKGMDIEAIKTIAQQFDHKFIMNGVRSPQYVEECECGWSLGRWYAPYHKKKCNRKDKQIQAGGIFEQIAASSAFTTGELTVDQGEITVSLADNKAPDHYMRRDMKELNRLQQKYAKWAAEIENAKDQKVAEQEKVAQEQAEKRKTGVSKLESLLEQVQILRKELGL